MENANWKNTIEFTPIVKGGRVIKITDGDTICIATKIPYLETLNESKIVYRFHIRLLGIDTPEMKSKNPEEKKLAYMARDFLQDMILNKNVILENMSTDKYGRILANVITEEGQDISNIMLDKRFAVTYDGGKKKSPENWNEYFLGGSNDIA